jgi:soluble lytic murein transglycosylase-like protein
VFEAAAKYGVEPCLVISLMQTESAFKPMAVSPKGASGLMQLMPETAARFGVKNIFDTRENISAGVRYLRWLLDRFGGDLRLALAGYNAGEGAVEYYGNQIPPYQETQNYVRQVYLRYSAAHALAEKAKARDEGGVQQEAASPQTHNQILNPVNQQERGLASKRGNQ